MNIVEKIRELFGSFEWQVIQLADGTEVVKPDMEYIAAVLIFIVIAYCVLRILGSVFRWK